MVDSIEKSSFDERIAQYTITYLDGSEITKDDVLQAGEHITYKVLIQYKKDILKSDLSSTDIDVNAFFQVNYVQAKEVIVDKLPYEKSWSFDYTGKEEQFIVPEDGMYKLEVWGAQGGSVDNDNIGGYGAYSVGTINLLKNSTLYIDVGGAGINGSGINTFNGGYNGGGDARVGNSNSYVGSGGGATHIATQSGLLSELSTNKSSIIIVAGGGGGAGKYSDQTASIGGHAGGFIGSNAIYSLANYDNVRSAGGGSQNSGGVFGYNTTRSSVAELTYLNDTYSNGSFGKGGTFASTSGVFGVSGGGGGYYGGGAASVLGGGGGSSYIGNPSLIDKVMYCYNCIEPDESSNNLETIKTISSFNVSQNPIRFYSKKSNGYAKITYLSSSNIFFDNYEIKESSISHLEINNNKQKVYFSTTLNQKDSIAEFNIDIVNNSRKDMYISEVIKNSYDRSKVEYSITNMDGTPLKKEDVIFNNSRKTITIRIKLLENIELDKEFFLRLKFNEFTDNKEPKIWDISYTGAETTFQVPYDGKYKLEVWGAQGGTIDNTNIGGYGSYSTGIVDLLKDSSLYINVGGTGTGGIGSNTYTGGYNGGGAAMSAYNDSYSASGGGATHIATTSGVLSSLSERTDSILIVAGGGGGAAKFRSESASTGGHAGGYLGNDAIYSIANYTYKRQATGGTQNSGGIFGYNTTRTSVSELSYLNSTYSNGSFGKGGTFASTSGLFGVSGGGGGYYGGGAASVLGGGGGSGYIGNINLYNKIMYCFDCQTNEIESQKTVSTINFSNYPTSFYVKKGNGYARITYLDS